MAGHFCLTVFRRIIFCAGCFFVLELLARTPDPITSEATSVLLTRARGMLENDQSEALLPYLKEILVRLEGNTSDDAQAARIFCLYQTGVCLMQTGKYAEAAAAFESFIADYPSESSSSTAALLAGEAYALQRNWPVVEKTVRPLLEDKRFDVKRQLMVRQMLSEAFYRQQKWKEAVVPLTEVFNQSKRDTVRSSSALMLSVCYAKTGDFENLYKFLPYCDDSVRQDAGLNVALIESGDKKCSGGAFQEALNLYQMVLLKADLLAYYERQLLAVKQFLSKPFVVNVGSLRSDYDEEYRAKQMQYDRLAEQLKKIKESPDYTVDIALRIARCYAGLGNNGAAYKLYNALYTQHPEHELAEESRFQAFMILLNMPQEQAAALSEGLAYLNNCPANRFTDEVTLNLMQLMLTAGNLVDARAMGLKGLQLRPDHRFIDQVCYLIAYIDFQKQDYEAARNAFTEILTRWPASNHAEASEYWRAMCNLFLGQYPKAVAAFDAYLKNLAWPTKSFGEDAAYRLGIAFYGAGDYPSAETAFRKFLKTYPLGSLRSEAFSMLGDLRRAAGELAVALDFYSKGIDAAATIDQVNYAVFQTAKVYELQKNYSAVIQLMENYLKDQGEKGNFASAGFWMGKSYKAMNQYSQALAVYVDTVVRFGNVLRNDSVDLILRELIKEYQSEQGRAGRPGFINTLMDALRQAEDRKEDVLALRLRTFFAYSTDGAEREKHVSVIFKEENIDKSGALTLLLFAEEASLSRNYALVYKACSRFKAEFNAAELFPNIMNLKLNALIQEVKYMEAVALAEEIIGRFGYQPPIRLTLKLKADALRLLKQYDSAIKTYNELFMIREWRGPLIPQALYGIGICLEAQGKPDEAFAFFQRIYVLYEGYTEWVAKAYEGSVRCLEKLGRRDDMIKTLREMVSKADVVATPEGKIAQGMLDRLVSAGGRK